MAAEQLDLAMQALSAAPADAGTAVHETRKAIKRLRTIDRLRACTLPSKRRRRRRKALRSAAQALSGARDAEVALATLEATIVQGEERLASRPGVMRLRASLLAERIAAEDELKTARGGGVEAALMTLSSLKEEEGVQGGSQPSGSGWTVTGLMKIYATGRKAMWRALRSEEATDMHEWRKRVKDLRYAAEALTTVGKQDAATERMRRLAKRADKLGEALGEEHDLALLAARVKAQRALFAKDRKGRKALLRALKRRRRRLRKQTSKLGRKLYDDKPKRFAKRMKRALA